MRQVAISSGEAEKAVYKTHFSRCAGFEQEALPLAYPRDFEAFDRCGGRGQSFETARWIYQLLDRAASR